MGCCGKSAPKLNVRNTYQVRIIAEKLLATLVFENFRLGPTEPDDNNTFVVDGDEHGALLAMELHASVDIPDQVDVFVNKKNRIQFVSHSMTESDGKKFYVPVRHQFIDADARATSDQLSFKWMKDKFRVKKRSGIPYALQERPASYREKALPDSPLDTFEKYKKIVDECDYGDRSSLMKSWASDSSYGKQQLQGFAPTLVEGCEELPVAFRKELPTDSVYYKIDLTWIESCFKNGLAPFAIFRVKRGVFVPQAIQLEKHGVVYTPLNSSAEWVRAKVWLQHSIVNVHQVVLRNLLAYQVPNAVLIAMARSVPVHHPLFKWVAGRVAFGAETDVQVLAQVLGCDVNAMANAGAERFSWKRSFAHDHDIKARKIDNLVDYPYRDDGNMVWKEILRETAADMRGLFKRDSFVEKDRVIKQWVHEINKNAVSTTDSLEISTLANLSTFLSSLVFRANHYRGAINAHSWDHLSYVPNAPPIITLPLPTGEQYITNLDPVLAGFPNHNTTVRWLKLLSEQAQDRNTRMPSKRILGQLRKVNDVHRERSYLGFV